MFDTMNAKSRIPVLLALLLFNFRLWLLLRHCRCGT